MWLVRKTTRSTVRLCIWILTRWSGVQILACRLFFFHALAQLGERKSYCSLFKSSCEKLFFTECLVWQHATYLMSLVRLQGQTKSHPKPETRKCVALMFFFATRARDLFDPYFFFFLNKRTRSMTWRAPLVASTSARTMCAFRSRSSTMTTWSHALLQKSRR